MKYEANHPKIPGSGRPKGALGKRARFAQQIMIDEKVEPLAALAKIWRNKRMAFAIRLQCLTAMLPYCYPRLSAVSAETRSEVSLVSIDRIRDNPLLARIAEDLALGLVEQPLMLEAAPAAEYIDA
jgi:hypothetical protein